MQPTLLYETFANVCAMVTTSVVKRRGSSIKITTHTTEAMFSTIVEPQLRHAVNRNFHEYVWTDIPETGSGCSVETDAREFAAWAMRVEAKDRMTLLYVNKLEAIAVLFEFDLI